MNTRLLIIISLLLLATQASAQEIKTVLSEKSVQVGDLVTVTYEIKYSKAQEVVATPFRQPIRAFRSNIKTDRPDTIDVIAVKEMPDTLVKLQGKYYWQRKLQVLLTDTGYLVLPPRMLTVNKDTMMTQPALLRVDLVPEQKDLDLYDIQEHFTELPPKPFNVVEWMSKYGWILLLIGLTLMVVFGVRWYIKSKPAPVLPPISPEEKAIKELNQLIEQQLWKQAQPKVHFVQLTLILKHYLSSVQGAEYLEKTSTEIVLKLKQDGVSEQDGRRWSFLLNVADMVKFAQSNVEESTIESLNDQAKTLILNHRQQ